MIGLTTIFFCCIQCSVIRRFASLSFISITVEKDSFVLILLPNFSNSDRDCRFGLSAHRTPVAIYLLGHPVSFNTAQQYLENIVGGINFNGINFHIVICSPLYFGISISHLIPFSSRLLNTFRICRTVCGASAVVWLLCTSNGMPPYGRVLTSRQNLSHRNMHTQVAFHNVSVRGRTQAESSQLLFALNPFISPIQTLPVRYSAYKSSVQLYALQLSDMDNSLSQVLLP